MIPYQDALARQLQYVDDISVGKRLDTIVFCSHPPVVTVGRATEASDILDWEGELVEVSRGGRATYHGPDQMVVYPILDLNKRGRDLHQHLRFLENIVSLVLKDYGIRGEVHSGATGVWVGDKKICSIGIAVKKWISYHGLSFAVDYNPEAYKGINPCGYSSDVMTNLETLLGRPVDRTEIIEKTKAAFRLFCGT